LGFRPGPWGSESVRFARGQGNAKRLRFEFRVLKIIPWTLSTEIAEKHPAGFANIGEDNND
jgi:hypothetical protein